MRRRAMCVCLVLLAAACAKSPEAKRDAALESVASWASTASLIARQWSAGQLPDAYVKKTARIAVEEIAKLEAPDGEPVARAWRQLGAAVESDDRAAATALVTPMHDFAEAIDRARKNGPR